MSGIAGLFYRDGRPVAAAELECMSARLAHRGGDGAGAWHSGPAGLGTADLEVARLSLSRGLDLAVGL